MFSNGGLQLAHLKSPDRQSLDILFGRFIAIMETRFILITSWNLDPYLIPHFGDDFMEVQPKRTCLWPRLGQRNGMFMYHTFKSASAMPTYKAVVKFWISCGATP
jgi:hypothetical protein